jgi:regulatory protein
VGVPIYMEINQIRQQALKWLARREYSRGELFDKLHHKGWATEAINAVIDELAQERLQDDQRFLAAYIRYRREAGFGPRRIAAELAQRGISQTPVELAEENTESWLTVLDKVWRKKFGGQLPRDLKARVRQARFLIYRGFAPEQVHEFLKGRSS